MVIQVLPSQQGSGGPQRLAFHSAALLNGSMLIFGGEEHVHFYDETCFSPRLYSYDLSCGSWATLPANLNPGNQNLRVARFESFKIHETLAKIAISLQ